jgi:uroporphyrinogen decarboxylase
VDRVPFTMWRHFYFQAQTAKGLAATTLSFYHQYDLDVIVLAPGPFYMAEGWGADVRSFGTDDMVPYVAGATIARATDWRYLNPLDVNASSLGREIEAVRQICAQLGEREAPLIVPLFSPLTTADILCGGRIVEDVRSFSNDLRSALSSIATATYEFGLACLEVGADGFMFVTRLANPDRVRAREYRDFGQQFDLQVLNRLKEAPIRILQLDSENAYFDLANRYPVQAVCWETWRSSPSLSSARRQLRCGLMGGLNPMTFSGGSVEDVRAQVLDAISQTGGWHLLIAPSGPLPSDSREELLSSVSETVHGS